MRISTIHVRALVGAAESLGLPRQRLFDAARLSADLLADDYAFVSVSQLDMLTCTAVRLTEEPGFGLRWAERSSVLQFDVCSLLIAAAPSVRAGIEVVLRIQPMLGDHPEFQFLDHADHAELRFDPLPVSNECVRVRADVAVAGFFQLFTLMGASEQDVPFASFAHARPSYGALYERVFAGRVRFGQPNTGIGVSHALLARPLGAPNPALFEALQHQALRLHERLDNRASMQSRVARFVRASLPRLPSMRDAAQALALSERSLRRRLADEGTSYTQVAETVRLKVARELLGSRERPIKQIASELGFSELSAFHRAFKRWTGDTPVAFRARSGAC